MELAKLNESIKSLLHEFYDITGMDSVEMEIVDFGTDASGGHRFELDGIEFYLGEDEELINAVDICIEMEFLPEWEEQGLESYNVDSVQFDEETGKGTAYVGLFWEEDLDESLNEADDKFNYMMLDRLRTDCEYFLGYGNGYEPHLWAGNVEDQIAEMRKIYDKLPEKPEWLSLEDIDKYEKDMLAKRASKNEDFSPNYTLAYFDKKSDELLQDPIPYETEAGALYAYKQAKRNLADFEYVELSKHVGDGVYEPVKNSDIPDIAD